MQIFCGTGSEFVAPVCLPQYSIGNDTAVDCTTYPNSCPHGMCNKNTNDTYSCIALNSLGLGQSCSISEENGIKTSVYTSESVVCIVKVGGESTQSVTSLPILTKWIWLYE
ncbi:hypothetical protein DFA_07183 [Cavenderia fasciculata]|uniref:Uncharacterized protein n=1 Tax=Cavenderia fasciculata TaxID=261658 RepID=F4PVQ2_CACFS|nr:uncharacterized protein DFA_07183 [Cavenderia fasciculata]EGG20066.1 hypothetical protein DFA_07183 [Cavenderia fasciculata]|eukprot:XP_004367049.1 hypothetical protein DFA_07183 [Cavenderia fasciculata]